MRLIEGPFDVDDRTALLLTDAGKETLAARLAKEGRATLGQLQQFGGDLLDVMSYLDGKGIFHRDVKPANLGIAPDPGSRRPTLVLFDLSLASADVDNLDVRHTRVPGPVPGPGPAAALRPGRRALLRLGDAVRDGDGGAAVVARRLGPSPEPARRPGRRAGLVRAGRGGPARRHCSSSALNPDVKHRYSTADELAIAWQEVFASLDAREETAESNDALAEAAVADTPLERSGLSTRARSALARLDLATVGDLLAVHPARINTIRGLGEAYRKEIQRRIKQWRTRLAVTEEPVVVGLASGTERLLATLLDELASDDRAIVEAMLELDGAVDAAPRWPAAAEVAQKLHLTREQVVHAVDTAVTTWTKGKAPALPGVRDEAVRILAREGRVTTLPGLAMALAAERGSLLAGAERTRRGAALLRAAYELDARDAEPALELRRSKRRPTLVALREGADPDLTGRGFPTADVLLEAAAELGRAADELVGATEGTGVIPAVTAVAALEAAVDEVGAAGLTDDRRLLRLAAAAADVAALSGFDELYPVDLKAGVAVELALSGKPGRQISEAAVRRSVATRFPHVAAPGGGPRARRPRQEGDAGPGAPRRHLRARHHPPLPGHRQQRHDPGADGPVRGGDAAARLAAPPRGADAVHDPQALRPHDARPGRAVRRRHPRRRRAARHRHPRAGRRQRDRLARSCSTSTPGRAAGATGRTSSAWCRRPWRPAGPSGSPRRGRC